VTADKISSGEGGDKLEDIFGGSLECNKYDGCRQLALAIAFGMGVQTGRSLEIRSEGV